MNTKTILTSLFAAVIAFIAVLIIMFYVLNYFLNQNDYSTFSTLEVSATKAPSSQNIQDTTAPNTSQPINIDKIDFNKYSHYILKTYSNKIGIFAPDNLETPVTIIDVNISSLPELDRQMLQLGITAKTKDELLMTIEDYTS